MKTRHPRGVLRNSKLVRPGLLHRREVVLADVMRGIGAAGICCDVPVTAGADGGVRPARRAGDETQ
jgi:hypothetical protein